MAKKAPKVVVADPTDAEIAALEAEIAGDDPGDSNAHTAPVEHDVIMLEEGGTVPVFKDQIRMFRVQALDGTSYDHCSDHPVTGEWIYRSCNA